MVKTMPDYSSLGMGMNRLGARDVNLVNLGDHPVSMENSLRAGKRMFPRNFGANPQLNQSVDEIRERNFSAVG